MKFAILALLVLGQSLALQDLASFDAQKPLGQDYIKFCEHLLPAEDQYKIQEIFEKWEVDEAPSTKCHLYCIVKNFKWIDGRGQKPQILHENIANDFKASGKSSALTRKPLIKALASCNIQLEDKCEAGFALYVCLLNEYQSDFQDVFLDVEEKSKTY